MKLLRHGALLCALLFVIKAEAQVDFLGFGDYIRDALTSNFPASPLRTQLVDQIPDAIGQGGTAIVRGIDSHGNLMGDGVSGATRASANFNISSGILSSTVTYDTNVSWNSYAHSDGKVWIKLTVVWGNSSASYTRTIDIQSNMPNNTAVNANAPIPTVYTGENYNYQGTYGTYTLVSVPMQYGYVASDGTYWVVAYTAWVWQFNPATPPGGGNEGAN